MKNKSEKSKTKIITTDLVPRGKSILISRVSLETKAASGIIIAESKKGEGKATGIIVACGPDCREDLRNNIGSLVLFNPFANLQVIDRYNNVMLFMEDQDIRCFISADTVILDDTDKEFERIDIDNN